MSLRSAITLAYVGIADGITLDMATAALASPYATEILAREDSPEGRRRMAVRTAILLAQAG